MILSFRCKQHCWHAEGILTHLVSTAPERIVFQMNQIVHDYLLHVVPEDMQDLFAETNQQVDHGYISQFYKVSYPMLLPHIKGDMPRLTNQEFTI